MSIKKFNLNEDVFSNEYYEVQNIGFGNYYFSGSNSGSTNYKFPNHYVTGGVSGSWYVEIYDNDWSMPSSTKLLCLSFGYTTSSAYYDAAVGSYQSQKLRMYRLFAKKLLGDESRVFKNRYGKEILNAIFISISRNHYRDTIGLGSLDTDIASVAYFVSGSPGSQTTQWLSESLFYGDNYFYAQNEKAYYDSEPSQPAGIVFPKAGIFVLDVLDSVDYVISGSAFIDELLIGSNGNGYRDLLWALKHKIAYIYFSSKSKIASSFFRCTALPEEFNYSSNPSFVGSSQEIKTAISSSAPTVYFTNVALLDDNGETVAVAKTKSPIKKHFGIGVTVTVRLDY